uniref:Ribonuclease E n=1 Tax=Hildenbrandia rivularis TaxID=135206 RepID=A0A1C9CFK3_9FLOR|nr:ribonuclease E [Hildenbrandia rivularis]AOM67161.1 ribonuclease E [Hildenbrandia rivularis]
MKKKLIISRLHNIAAILYNNRIQEFTIINNTYQVSDIYLGVVNKIFPGINAAFVELQTRKKNGFIHASDSGPLKRKPNITNITKIFSIHQKILVQIVKESTLHKGPKLTANIALSGRYIIFMPFSHTICIAKNISDEKQRHHLKALAILLKPLNMGVLFRENSVGINENVILEEINSLRKQWNFIQKSALAGTNPYLIYKHNNIVQKSLKDFYDPSIQKIIVDSAKTLLQVNQYFQKQIHCPKQLNTCLKLLASCQYFPEKFRLISKLLENLGNHVLLPLGGYLSIEVSNALTMIDVNSGSFQNASNSRETVLMINCLAATEIGYQLCKRNITGIIVIDFINMHNQQDKLYLLEHLCTTLNRDWTKPQIVQLSELGLVEIVRQRKSKNLLEISSEHLLLSNSRLLINSNRGFYSNNSYVFFKKIFPWVHILTLKYNIKIV